MKQESKTTINISDLEDSLHYDTYDNGTSTEFPGSYISEFISDVDYKHNEGNLLDEMKAYIDETYDEHYAGNNGVQPNDLIEASGNAMGFYLGNVIKYGARYGKKAGYNRKDIIKIIHYGLLALNEHDASDVDDDEELY
jgi:hypothetical protein